MRKYALLILILFSFFSSKDAYAIKDTISHYYSFDQLKPRDTLFIDNFYNSVHQARFTFPRAYLKKAHHVLSLYIEPDWGEEWKDQKYTAYLVGYLLAGPKDNMDTLRFSLTVDYDIKNAASYKAKDVLVRPLTEGGTFSILVIDQQLSRIENSLGQRMNANQPGMIFKVGNQIQFENGYQLREGMLMIGTPLAYNVNASSKTIHFTWRKQVIAEHYDLEWFFVDDYKGTGTQRKTFNEIFSGVNREYVDGLKKQSVRINTIDTFYSLPLIFESGYLVVRVRAIGTGGVSYDQPVYGPWKEETIQVTDEFTADKINWQYIAVFADGGKRRDMVSFMDGTLRERQSLVSLNTEKNILVSETIYDHQGRPAIEMLPAPVMGGSSPAIKYHSNFNISAVTNQAYSRDDFDTTSQLCAAPTPAPLKNSSGAGKYYSTNNNTAGIHQYIPDAEGFPFMQTEYTPDLTGRVRSSGMAGYNHQLGRQHQKSFEYSNPSQSELDKLFGNNIGYAGFYDKESMKDENGQLMITYKDGKGNVVASALAGAGPVMLDTLEKGSQAIRIDLLEEGNVADSVAHTLTSMKNIELAVPTDLIVEYSIVGESFKAFVPGISDSLCMDCVYDLQIQLLNACGTVLFTQTQTIGNIQGAIFSCEANGYYIKDTISISEPGKYVLSKVLTINKATQEKYEEEYLKLQSTDIVRRSMLDAIPPKAISAGCVECIPCKYEEKVITLADGTKSTIKVKDPNATRGAPCMDHCPGSTSPCQGAYEAMLRDMSPGGQYAEYLYTNDDGESDIQPWRFPFSVLYWNNRLARPVGAGAGQPAERSWRTPAFEYRNADGSISYVPVYNNEGNISGYIKPNQLTLVDSFIRYWKSSWAASLVPYHPEYCYYEWCIRNENLLRFNDHVQAITTYKQASDSGIATIGQLKQADPLRNNNVLFARFNDRLNRFFLISPNKFLSVEKAAVAIVNCLHSQSTGEELFDCAQATDMYAPGQTVQGKDMEWFYMQSFYLMVRRKLLEEERKEFVLKKPGCITNDCIGTNIFANHSDEIQEGLSDFPENNQTNDDDLIGTVNSTNAGCCKYIVPAGISIDPSGGITINGSQMADMSPGHCQLLRDKSKIFYESNDIFDYIDTAVLRERVNQTLYINCGKCIEVHQLELLLNALAETGNLITQVTVPSTPPLVLYEELLEHFITPHGDTYEIVPSFDPSRTSLYLSFRPNGIPNTTAEVFGLQLRIADSSMWRRMKFIKCLVTTGRNSFTAKGYLDDNTEVAISGDTKFIDFTTCKPPNHCKLNDRADDLKRLLQHVLKAQAKYFTGTGLKTIPAAIGRPVFRTPGNDPRSWFWRLNNVTTSGNSRTYDAEVLELTLPPGFLDHLRDKTRVFELLPRPGILPLQSYRDFIKGRLSKEKQVDVLRRIVEYIERPTTSRIYKKYLKKCPVKIINQQRNQQDILSFEDFDVFTLDIPGDIDSTKCTHSRAILMGNISGNPKKSSLIVESTCFRIIDCCVQKGNKPICCLPPGALTLHVFPDSNACEKDLAEYEDIAGDRYADDMIENKLDSIRKAYYRKCFRAIERFSSSYSDEIYHYTLYYYDRAGNLMKTVPPNGVDTLNAAEISNAANSRRSGTSPIYREHRLATTYEYNSLNQVIKTNSPDGGLTLYCYDENGRLILSQNAYNRVKNRAIYTMYDLLGRITETGECAAILKNGRLPDTLRYKNFHSRIIADNSRAEIAQTIYDAQLNATVPGYFVTGQEHLRNRVATIIFRRKLSGPYDQATHYSYDIHGNVKELVQEYSELARKYPFLVTNNNHIKRIRYEYDVIIGKVKRAIYQEDQSDQFIHYYTYDADNRLKEVKTTASLYEDSATMDVDASYQYYDHGALARMELGKDKVQGLDFVYTINGWMKAINSDTLNAALDIGRDGHTNRRVAKDVFGFSLGYFNGDYKPIGGSGFAGSVSQKTNSLFVTGSLYNGNISHIVTANAAFVSKPVQATLYRYDQLNRLKDMQVFEKSGTVWDLGTVSQKFRNTFIYDANGNIITQARKDGNGVLFDSLRYMYRTGNNQLTHVRDNLPGTLKNYDIDDQQPNNYSYDAIGRLTRDVAEGLDSINWGNHHKPYFIAKAGGDTVAFTYDGLNSRVTKTFKGKTTLYVKDATGNVVATYQIENNSYKLSEQYLYGSKRIGIVKQEVAQMPNRLKQKRGEKSYELSNHLGNILAVVSDRRLFTGTDYSAQVTSASDYYPFGMEMQERKFVSNEYRYGFNGYEKENEIKGNGNSLDFGERFSDPRLGLFLSIDPLAGNYPSQSPYVLAANNPVALIDVRGMGPIEALREWFDQNRAGKIEDEADPEDPEMFNKLYEAREIRARGLEGAGNTFIATADVVQVMAPGPQVSSKPGVFRRLFSLFKKEEAPAAKVVANEIGASGEARLKTLYNDMENGKALTNCVRCVTSWVESRIFGSVQRVASEFMERKNGGLIYKALEHITADTKVTFGKAVGDVEMMRKLPGDYVVFTGVMKGQRAEHVLTATVADNGAVKFYDPQSGAEYLYPKTEKWIAYPVVYPK